MKRRERERRLRIAGCYLKREGSSHSLWINPKHGIIETIPRHTEIKEPLAKKILKLTDSDNCFKLNLWLCQSDPKSSTIPA